MHWFGSLTFSYSIYFWFSKDETRLSLSGMPEFYLSVILISSQNNWWPSGSCWFRLFSLQWQRATFLISPGLGTLSCVIPKPVRPRPGKSLQWLEAGALEVNSCAGPLFWGRISKNGNVQVILDQFILPGSSPEAFEDKLSGLILDQ